MNERKPDRCGHRSPLNYDRSRYATCAKPKGHDGYHGDGRYVWTDRTMPWLPTRTAL